MGKYDLTHLNLDELNEDSSAPASGDFLLRYDASADAFVKVDATDENALGTGGSTVVNLTAATLTVTAALHNGNMITVNRAAGSTLTLPAASGSGAVYTIVVGTTVTSNAITVQAASASDSFVGSVRGVDTDAEGATGYQWNADANDDTVAMDGTATGGVAGDILIIRDIASGVFQIEGTLTQSGASEATPFSAAVS